MGTSHLDTAKPRREKLIPEAARKRHAAARVLVVVAALVVAPAPPMLRADVLMKGTK